MLLERKYGRLGRNSTGKAPPKAAQSRPLPDSPGAAAARRWMDALMEVLRDALLQADAADAASSPTAAGGGRAGDGAASPVGRGAKGASKWGSARAIASGRLQSFRT